MDEGLGLVVRSSRWKYREGGHGWVMDRFVYDGSTGKVDINE